jgi:hypothetical protein
MANRYNYFGDADIDDNNRSIVYHPRRRGQPGLKRSGIAPAARAHTMAPVILTRGPPSVIRNAIGPIVARAPHFGFP